MHKNANFLESLRCAWTGIRRAVRTERNLRFHLCIANLICVFAWYFGISRAEWGLLFLAIAFMLVTELFNTALEQAADAANGAVFRSCENGKGRGGGRRSDSGGSGADCRMHSIFRLGKNYIYACAHFYQLGYFSSMPSAWRSGCIVFNIWRRTE